MKCMKVAVVIGALAVAHGPATAEETITPIEVQIDRFRLWNACEPTRPLVETLNDDAAEIGLTKERIETAIHSRLRGAKIFTDNKLNYTLLYVRVSVVGDAFGYDIDFRKRMTDTGPSETASGFDGFATTWNRSGLGTHGQDAGYILQHLSKQIDEFIDEFLRVNEEAC